MNPESYIWIQTRDGSPTLWSNDLGECFRSIKGAFTESWNVFVKPAIDQTQELKILNPTVGEFGLGPGTNWLLTQSVAKILGLPINYFVIEHDLRSFQMGLQKWQEIWPSVKLFLQSLQLGDVNFELQHLEKPLIYSSLQQAIEASAKCNFWYHDPFGYDVNPDGYEPETLKQCSRLWNPKTLGMSYACNKIFQQELNNLGAKVQTIDNPNPGLKRQRLQFVWTVKES